MNMKSNLTKILAIFIGCCFFSDLVIAQDDTYATPERLFHVERSKNKNIICYDVKFDEQNKWNSSDPINIYWVNREETPGKTNGLSAIQKRLAFGYKSISKDDNSCKIALNASKDREITILLKGRRYIAEMMINNKPARLTKVFVQASPNNSLSVEYVELFGIEDETGEEISEKIYK